MSSDKNDLDLQNDSDLRQFQRVQDQLDNKTLCAWFEIACCNRNVGLIRALLQHQSFDTAVDCGKKKSQLDYACRWNDMDVVTILIQDDRFVQQRMFDRYLESACVGHHLNIVCRLVQHANCTASQDTFNLVIERALGRKLAPRHDIVDMVVNNSDFDMMQNDRLLVVLDKIAMIRSKAATVCIALQDIGLPALITLEILDALVPNNIRMAAKWDLIVAVKHWHK